MISPRVNSNSLGSPQLGPPQSSAEAAANTPPAPQETLPDAATREAWIRQTAYFRSEQRGFAPGGELEDWLEAEREIERRYPRGQKPLLLPRLRGRRAAR